MATNELKTRIKHAYKTESDWTSSNPVLLKGEVAYSSDKNNKYKVGDGTHTWSDLTYAIPVTKSDIGLGNVDNTADANKSVKYATSAGNATSATKVNGHTVNSDVPSSAKFTDTKVTSVGNHYTPSGGTTKSASGGTATNATGSGNAVQVVTGVTVDAAGHVTGVTSKGVYSTDTNTDTWRPLGTTADTACAGNDSRLSNARPASDVSSWAKASTKPTYTASEVGALPLSGGTMTGNIIIPKNDNMGIIPDTNNYGQIGSSDKKFYRMYATTFNGNLNGTTATVSGTATLGNAKIGSNGDILINDNMITCGTNKPIRLNDTETDNNEGKHVVVGSPGIMVKGGVCLTNGSGLYARRADSDDWKHLAGIDTNNNTLYGASSYNDELGDVYYRGNQVLIQSKGGVHITSPTAGLTNRAYGVNNVLWSGEAYPNANSNLVLSEAISSQPNGVVIFFQWYDRTNWKAANVDMQSFFIPKSAIVNNPGGYNFSAIDYGGGYAFSKYLYIGDTSIIGADLNTWDETTTASGVKITNWNYVLTRIIGV